jgi:dTDP-L-rhamnose 4-epimerase
MGRSWIEPEITGKYRAGDIRHCFSNNAKTTSLLGFKPSVDFEQGLDEFAAYLTDQMAEDHADRATEELTRRGLVA